MKFKFPKIRPPLTALYTQAGLSRDVQISLFFVLVSNIFGMAHGQICSSGSNAIIQLSNYLGAGDFEYGIITGIPLAASLLQIPYSNLVNRTHKRRLYLLTFGIFSRALWLLFGLVPFFVPTEPE